MLRDYQLQCVDAIMEKFKTHQSTMAVLFTAGGKCLGKGTPILMFDGSIQPVETLIEGDLLMGPDSQPRKVLSTCSGIDDLFNVIPKKGDPYVINSKHVLCLKMTNGSYKQTGRRFRDQQIVDISLEDYHNQVNAFRHCAKGWRTGVEFPHRPEACPIPPYYLGLWLGDGNSNNARISKPDPEIRDYVKSVAESYGLTSRNVAGGIDKCPTWSMSGTPKKTNPLVAQLRELNLIQNKHIPFDYKCNSREIREQVLAGILDADGSLSRYGYDFISKSQELADDVAYLCRSLGLAAYVSPCVKSCQTGASGTYYRICITGECSHLPLLIPRKKAPPRTCLKNPLVHGIKIVPLCRGEYFGFTITGDGRFLLGDFTVTHNTVIFANIIKKFLPGRTMVIAGQDALIWQAKRSIEHWAKVKCGVEMASSRANENSDRPDPVVLATWQTLISGGKAPKEGALFDTPSKRRMQRFKPENFDLVVYDEAHHSAAESYRIINNYFKKNPKIKILGVTATPKRGDGLALGEIFESVAFEMGIYEGSINGWLAHVVQHEYKLGGLDYSHLSISKGDFDAPELKAILEKQETVAGMCQPILEVMYGLEKNTLKKMPVEQWTEFLKGLNRKPRKTLLFTASVVQAEMACDMINRIVPGLSVWICGKHDKAEREDIYRDFELGEAAMLANVGIAIEGYDFPAIEVVAMGRPTLSISTYIQMVGRGTRVLPGVVDGLLTKEERLAAIHTSKKGYCRIIDFKGNSGRHNLITTFDVLGGRSSEEKIKRAKQRASESDSPKSVLKALSIAEAELEKEKKEAEERKKEVARQRKSELVPKSNYEVKEVSPFKNSGSNMPMPTDRRFEKPFSPAQRKMLLQWGFPIEKITYRQGQGVIGRAVKNGWKPVAGDKAWAIALNQSNPHNYKPKTDHEHAKHDYQLYLEKITA